MRVWSIRASGPEVRCRTQEGRGMTSPGVYLREITDDNRDAVCALRVRRSQKRFVASVPRSLADAATSPEANPWYRAVYSGDEPVGFVMLSWNVPPGRPGVIGPYFLWRLLIDKRHQKRRGGRAAPTP